MNTSDVLNKAADLIEERGWTANGTGWDGDGPLCLEGGIAAALGVAFSKAWACDAYKAVAAYLSDQTDALLFVWNDQLFHSRVREIIHAHDFGSGPFDMDAARSAAHKYGMSKVVETLRAAAIIAAAQETDVRVVAPELAVS